MQFKEGASVYTVDNEKVGTIDRIVINPETKDVTHVVVRKGFLFTEDKVVPMTSIGTVSPDRVYLHTQKTDLEEFPDFEETHYLTVEETVQPEAGTTRPTNTLFYYPPVGTGWLTGPVVYSPPLYIKRTEKNIPEGSVAIHEGTEVVSNDGEDIGEVARVFADAKDNATHLLVSEGLFQKEKKLIPTAWIKGMAEDKVRLAVDSTLLERLPEYQA